MPRIALPLAAYLNTQLGRCTGISFIGSASPSVRKNAHIAQRHVFRFGARQLAHRLFGTLAIDRRDMSQPLAARWLIGCGRVTAWA